MRSFRFFLRSFLPLLAAVWALAPPPARAAEQWVEVHSQHFTVVTDAGEKRGREVAERFEQMRAIFGSLILHEKVNIPVPLEIIGFRSGKEFRQFTPLWHGKPVQLAGLFQMGEDRNFILLDLSTPNPYQTVFHEYAHLLLNGNYPPTQPWFDEGFAVYYSTIEIDGKKVKIGVAPEGETEIIGHYGLMPVLKLFAVQHDSAAYNESDQQSLFYAESWLLVHYLMDHRLLPQLGKYFDLVENQNTPVTEAIQQAFGMDARRLDRTLQQYYGGGAMGLMIAPAPEADASTDVVDRLRATDAEAILADAHLHSRDYQAKAVEEFEQILAQDPTSAAAERGLGYACLRRQDYACAAQHFRQAARLNASDPRALYYSALLSFQQAQAGGQVPDDLGEMATNLHRALALDPGFADAYGLLAFVEMQQGSPTAAEETMQRALALRPRDLHYMLSYAQILLAANKAGQAQALFSRLAASDDVAVAGAARTWLERLQNPSPVMRVEPGGEASGATAATTAAAAPANVSTSSGAGADANAGGAGESVSAPPVQAAPPAPDRRPIRFLKGTLLAVDCSARPAAVATVLSGGREWRMRTTDSTQVVVLGADQFSCSWKNEKVAINYRSSGARAGDLVSIEIQ